VGRITISLFPRKVAYLRPQNRMLNDAWSPLMGRTAVGRLDAALDTLTDKMWDLTGVSHLYEQNLIHRHDHS